MTPDVRICELPNIARLSMARTWLTEGCSALASWARRFPPCVASRRFWSSFSLAWGCQRSPGGSIASCCPPLPSSSASPPMGRYARSRHDRSIHHHVPALRTSGDRAHAGRRLPVLLCVQGLRRTAQAPCRRLLRVLFLRLRPVSADAGGGGGELPILGALRGRYPVRLDARPIGPCVLPYRPAPDVKWLKFHKVSLLPMVGCHRTW